MINEKILSGYWDLNYVEYTVRKIASEICLFQKLITLTSPYRVFIRLCNLVDCELVISADTYRPVFQ